VKKALLTLIAPLFALLFIPGLAAAQGQYVSGTTGVDVSWPNCSASIPSVSFGIVGATGGTVYSDNSCMAAEANHFKNLSFYANTGWNNTSVHINANSPKVCVIGDNNCLAYNYGYNAGLQAVQYAEFQTLNANSMWWLDVENGNIWNTDTAQNRSSLQGEYDALLANSIIAIGAYSTTAQWNSITGNWINGWPSWGATTWKTAKQAAKYCTGHEFTGGKSYLMQYQGRNLDQDYAC